jgi:phospholipase C
MTTLNRRDFLRSARYGTGLALLPASIQKALALPATVVNRDITDVGHVVILMQENRSFDHYFGLLAGVRGFGDRFTIPRANGESALVQRNASRTVLPYHLDSSQGKALGVGTPHSWSDSQQAWDHGRMNRWPVAKSDYSMGYLKPADLSYHTALANAFTLCDHYHCGLHGGTNTNRLFHWTGTNRGSTNFSSGELCVVNNDGWDTVDGNGADKGFTWTTYPERLQKAGVGWKVYQFLPDNYTDNPLSGFASFRAAYSRVNQGNTASYSNATSVPAVQYNSVLHDTPASPFYEPLYKGIGRTEPIYPDTLAQFRADALADQLPSVSWIVGPAMYTEHPDFTPAQGAYFISQVIDALTANPAVWGKTVLFVNYDENDGYFDHLPPPCPPSPNGDGSYAGKSTTDTQRDYMNVPNATDIAAGKASVGDGRPFGPGMRVPMFVISPWSRGGYVNSQVHDHTSVLRFLEQRFGVVEPNISPWRRAVMGDLTSAFDFVNPNIDTTFVSTLPVQDPLTAELEYAQQSTSTAVAPPAVAAQALPVQAVGIRPARPLPYALDVLATVDATGAVTLGFVNNGKAGAVFHVYDRLHLDAIPRRYTVEAGKTLSDVWSAYGDALQYDLWVLGPNGFHRLFRGSLVSSPLALTSLFDAAGYGLQIILQNQGAQAATFTVTANAYRSDAPITRTLKPGERDTVPLALAASKGWYDFTVRGSGGFTRRLAGHLENGVASVSDPAMAVPQTVAAFSFADKIGVLPGDWAVSDPVALAGFSGYLPVSVTPGSEFSLDGGPFVAAAPAVCTGQSLTLRHRAASALATAMMSSVTVGSITASFKSVTASSVPTPSPTPTPVPVPVPVPVPAPVPVAAAPAAVGSGRFGGGAFGGWALTALAAARLLKKPVPQAESEAAPADGGKATS